MLRFILFATIFLNFASGAPAFAGASAPSHHSKPATASEKESFSFTGTVAKVDYAANSVEIDTKGRTVTVVVEPTTAIDIAGEPGSMSDIRPGVKLHVEGVIRNGTHVAQTITIRSGAKAKNHVIR
jgi:hypothetical protein